MGRRIGVAYRDPKKGEPYEAALRRAGLEPIALLPGTEPSLVRLSGLVLTGGTDVDPWLYDQQPDPATQEPDRERDTFELALVQQALGADLPLLAICRGMQLLNVALGGSLIQDLRTGIEHVVRPEAEPGRHPAAHRVTVRPATALAAMIGAGEQEVNSRHHQAIERPAAGLIVCATAPDGVIEAVEVSGKKFALAVQWHPEDRIEVSAADRRLFEAFARATRPARDSGAGRSRDTG